MSVRVMTYVWDSAPVGGSDLLADFINAQQISATAKPSDRRIRAYLLVGLLRCALCGRIMDSHWAHVRAGYRCRHGNRNVLTPVPDRVPYVYIREDRAIAGIAVLVGLGDEAPA